MGETEVPLGLLFYVEAEDRQKVKRSLEDLAEVLVEDGVDFHPDELGGVPVWLIEDEGAEITVGYGFIEDFAFVGSSLNMIELAVDSASLSESALFTRVIRQLPGKNRGYLYLDVVRGIEMFYDTMDVYDQDRFDEEIRPHVESIRAIGVASEPMAPSGTVRGVLFVDTRDD
jgi:hypothetical protein